MKLILIIFSLSFLFLAITLPAFANSLVIVKTNSNSYTEGDTIVISGNVSTIIENAPVTVQIFNQGNLVDVVQFNVAKDGSYSYTIITEGPHWSKSGTYAVRASYGEGNIAETQFNFSPKTYEHTTNIFEVDAGNFGTFDVKYSVKGGLVKNMITDRDIFALIVEIESKNSGSITLEIPREALDAKKQDKTDDTFIIIIDGIEAPYQETFTNTDSRMISIDFEEGDSDIEIIGSHILGGSVKSSPYTGNSGFSENSVFRIIPEKPSVGSTIRVVGVHFSPSFSLEFLIDGKNIEKFQPNNDGSFSFILHIPKDMKSDKIPFTIKDSKNNEKSISLRLGDVESRLSQSTKIPLTTTITPKPTPEIQSKIPTWIKSNAKWWADGSIDDATFVSGMKFLINEGTLKIPQTTPGTGTGSNEIPTWIKSNAKWWADGSIDDNSFVQGIQYLIKEGILKVSNDEKLIKEKLDKTEKTDLENEYSSKPREWITSGPFQIDRSKYAIGEKIFLVMNELNENEKGQIAFMRPLNDTHYSVYMTIPFDGSEKNAFNYYVEPQISKTREICSVDDITGKWVVVFRGTDYSNLYFEITNAVVPGTNTKPVC